VGVIVVIGRALVAGSLSSVEAWSPLENEKEATDQGVTVAAVKVSRVD
jgi:hypothetical protein